MLLKIICVIVLVKIVYCSSVKEVKTDLAPSPFYELPCMSFGGICLQKDECPEGKQVSVKGLCPLQQDKGVECCHSVAKSATTCLANGGECMPSSWKCPDYLTFTRATDCESDEKCCILVN